MSQTVGDRQPVVHPPGVFDKRCQPPPALAENAKLLSALYRACVTECKVSQGGGAGTRPDLSGVLAVEGVCASREIGRVGVKAVTEVYRPELDTVVPFVQSRNVFILEDNRTQELGIGARTSDHRAGGNT